MCLNIVVLCCAQILKYIIRNRIKYPKTKKQNNRIYDKSKILVPVKKGIRSVHVASVFSDSFHFCGRISLQIKVTITYFVMCERACKEFAPPKLHVQDHGRSEYKTITGYRTRSSLERWKRT